MILIINRMFLIFVFSVLSQLNSKGQQSDKSEFTLTNSCQWDRVAIRTKKVLHHKTGVVYERFGTSIINIKGKAYNPCNLPPNLIRKKVLISGILFKNNKIDGTPVKLTYLKLLSD